MGGAQSIHAGWLKKNRRPENTQQLVPNPNRPFLSFPCEYQYNTFGSAIHELLSRKSIWPNIATKPIAQNLAL